MWYLLGEIALLLLVAVALGMVVGWLLWGWRRVSVTRREFGRLMADRTELYQVKMEAKQERMRPTSPMPPPQAIEAPVAPTANRSQPNSDLGATMELSTTRRSMATSAVDDNGSLDGDDLLAIEGISPEIGEFLVGQGITDYRQVGSLTDQEIDGLEESLPEADRRIRADRWVEQARYLYNEKFRGTI